jgi:transforming growth factor beta, invertebrate
LHAFNTNNDNFNNNNKNKTNISQHKKRKNINNKTNFNGSENDLIFMRFELANIKISNNQNNNNKDDDAAAPTKSSDTSNINNVQSILHKARAKNTRGKLFTNNNNKDNNEDSGQDEADDDASLQQDDVELHPKDIEESILNILLVRKHKNRNKKNKNTINNKYLQKLNNKPNLVHKTANNTNSDITISPVLSKTSQRFHQVRHQNHHQNLRKRLKNVEMPEQGELSNEKTVRIHIYQLTEPYSRTWLDTKHISLDHLKHGQNQWVQLNIKKAVLGWLQDHEKNLGLEIICEQCNRNGISILHDYYSHPEQKPVLNIIAKMVQREKRARSRIFYPIVPDYITPPKRTSCSTDDVRKRCCRHPLLIDFHEISGFEFIIQPRIIDAGFCRGRCPPKYNPASHHAFLMSILNLDGRYDVPKRCCTALKLSEIDILHVDGEDPSKLSVSKWEDMRVMECACA